MYCINAKSMYAFLNHFEILIRKDIIKAQFSSLDTILPVS